MRAPLITVTGIAALLGLIGCTARPVTERAVPVVGCYEPEIGPYLGDITELESSEREWFPSPPYYELTHDPLEVWPVPPDHGGRWYRIESPETSTPEILTKEGGWRVIGNDSVVIQWRGEYNLVEYRLQVEPHRLSGQATAHAHAPDVKPTEPKHITARRVECVRDG